METQTEVIRYRVPKCEACGARNIIAGPESPTNPVLTCPKCGEYSGVNASYGDCPHNPRHAWNERGICLKAQAKSRKRVKHVVSSYQIPHLWYHKVQDSAKNSSGSVFFDGDAIYSYGKHFPIARHVKNKSKRNAVLFTTRKYSVTTSGHCRMVRSAIPQNTLVFHVPDLNPEKAWSDDHQVNLKAYATKIKSHLDEVLRARSVSHKTWEHARAKGLRAEALKYCQFFNVKPATKLPEVPTLNSKTVAELKRKEAERVAKRAAKTA